MRNKSTQASSIERETGGREEEEVEEKMKRGEGRGEREEEREEKRQGMGKR